jgi:MinD superfamily P-loop ATPase
MGAIIAAGGKYEIKPEMCANCGVCAAQCPMGAIAKEEPAKPTEK